MVGGDWDVDNVRDFASLNVYQSLKEALTEGVPWPDTGLYKRIVRLMDEGRAPWGCCDVDDLEHRCRYLERLYAEISHNGYKSAKQLAELQSADFDGSSIEVGVAIGRDGEMLFTNGRHRLTIAKLLDLPEIPVHVIVRHPEWMAFRREVEAFAAGNGGKVDRPLLHPDLASIPAREEPWVEVHGVAP